MNDFDPTSATYQALVAAVLWKSLPWIGDQLRNVGGFIAAELVTWRQWYQSRHASPPGVLHDPVLATSPGGLSP